MTTTEKYQQAFQVLNERPFSMTAEAWTRSQGVSKALAYVSQEMGIIERRGRYIAVPSVPALSVVEQVRMRMCEGIGAQVGNSKRHKQKGEVRKAQARRTPAPTIMLPFPVNTQKVGLIRRFINWIY